jgi:hypothetical protein
VSVFEHLGTTKRVGNGKIVVVDDLLPRPTVVLAIFAIVGKVNDAGGELDGIAFATNVTTSWPETVTIILVQKPIKPTAIQSDWPAIDGSVFFVALVDANKNTK